MKRRLRDVWFRLRGVNPEAVVVCFGTGEDALAREMAAEVQRLIPDRAHYFVSVGQRQPVSGAQLVVLQDGPAGALWLQLRQAFRGLRIGMAPTLFTGDATHDALRWAAFTLAPRKVLAYNARLERHHLQASCPIASYLFWQGVPLDRIWLRPKWLFPWRRERTTHPHAVRTIDGRDFSPARARVAVLSPYLPWPLAHGGAVRIYHLLREAALTHDIVLLAFVEDDRPVTVGPLREICAHMVLVQKPDYREPRWSTLDPPEVGEYTTEAMQRALADVRRKFDVALVQAEYTQLASYRPDILVEHDITFDLYRQVYERKQTRGARWDWWRWRRFEAKALASTPRVVVMSPKDAAQTGRKDAVVIPNGVDLGRFHPSPEPEGRHLLFIGSFRHFPNVLAYRFLVEEVWPVLVRSLPGLQLTVVAGTQPETYWREVTGTRKVPAPEAVKLLEFVADVKPLYNACNVVVVPTPVSAGTNVKVLEAMAAQRAVVSTTCGCAGLGLVHGVSVWVADGAMAFQEGVARLLENGALRVSLAQAARRHAERYFSWTRLGALQRRLWCEVAPAPVRIRKAVARDSSDIARIQSASPEASQWIPESYLEHHCAVAELKGQTAGFVVWRETTRGEREILNLAVAPEWRRQGLGAQLLASVLDGSSAEWYLEVRESNQAARKLYERLGFTVAGTRPDYYTDSHESGIVLRFRSC